MARRPARKAGVLDLESGCGRETDSALEGDGFEPSVPRRIRCRFHDGSPVSHEGLTVTQTRNHEFEFVSLQGSRGESANFKKDAKKRGVG